MCAIMSAVDQIILDIWPVLLEFGLINDLLLFVTVSVAGDEDPWQKLPNECQLRPHLYGLGVPETTLPSSYPGRGNF